MKGERTLFGEKMRKKIYQGGKREERGAALHFSAGEAVAELKERIHHHPIVEEEEEDERRRKKKVGFCPPFHLFSTLKDLRLDSTQLFVPFFIFIDCRWLLCVSDM